MGDAPVADAPALGRLSTFGVAEPWQALLLAPARYESLARVVDSGRVLYQATSEDVVNARGAIERRDAVVGVVVSPAQYDPVKKRSRLTVRLSDGADVLVMGFGSPDQWPAAWRTMGARASMIGKMIIGGDGFALLSGPGPV